MTNPKLIWRSMPTKARAERAAVNVKFLVKFFKTFSFPPCRGNIRKETFFHPDCTVGLGISPNPALVRSRAITADRELHPSPKARRFYLKERAKSSPNRQETVSGVRISGVPLPNTLPSLSRRISSQNIFAISRS